MASVPSTHAPGKAATEAWLLRLKEGYEVCLAAMEQEVKDGCHQPLVGTEGSTLSPEAIKQEYPTVMESMNNWPIRHAPEKPGQITPERCWSGNKVSWHPTQSRLTDEACIFALLMLPAAERTKLFPYDFDESGNPHPTRVPKPPTVVAIQNNIPFLLVWRDTYIFTGGSNVAGWLLKPEYPTERGRVNKGWFRAGLVVAPFGVESSSGEGGLDCVLTARQPKKPRNICFAPQGTTLASTWDYAHAENGVPLRGVTSAMSHTTLVIQPNAGFIAMEKIPGYHDDISRQCPIFRPQTSRDITSLPDYQVIDWGRIRTSKKRRVAEEPAVESGEAENPDTTSNNPDVASNAESPYTALKAENPDTTSDKSSLNTVISPPDFAPTSLLVEPRSELRSDLDSSRQFNDAMGTIARIGPLQWPHIQRALASLENARLPIGANSIASGLLAHPPNQQDRQQLLEMLAPASKPQPWMQEVATAAANDSQYGRAVLDALNWYDNIAYVRQMLASLDGPRVELDSYREIMEHFDEADKNPIPQPSGIGPALRAWLAEQEQGKDPSD
ncbi:unnamed protein product [Penicillium bialowiezense]